MLLSHKANINLRNKQGETALILACKHNNTKLALQLIANHPELDFEDKDHNTALSIARKNNNEEIVHAIEAEYKKQHMAANITTTTRFTGKT